MTDVQRTIDRIDFANPVPVREELPSSAMSASDLLSRIDERSTAMTDTLTPIRGTEPGPPRQRNRGPLIAVGVAAVLILLIGIVTTNIFTGGEQEVVETPLATTEAPVTTTVAPSDELVSPLGSDAAPLDVMAALQQEWDAGNLAEGEALFHPDSAYFTQNVRPGFAAELWYRTAVGATTEHDCVIATPPELADYSAVGTVVSCVDTITSATGEMIGGGTWAIDVADGWIMEIFLVGFEGALEERGGVNRFLADYQSWVRDRFPDDFDTLFDSTTLVMVVDDDAAYAQHRELIPFFVADTGPRGERALPADTPLLEVVQIFAERWDAGDIEGYEAIFHPLGGYVSGQDAATSWFTVVTGTTTERDCGLITPTQVRCTEVMSPGLLPGTTLDPHTVVWNGAAGYLWTIEFPNGPPDAFADPGNAPGVKEYRDWVRANAPDQFDTLFVGGLLMRLDTEEARDAHVAMIADYLAAISG